MKRLGWLLTLAGGLLILSPLVVVIADVTVGAGPTVVLDRAPTFVLGGLVAFVVGIALRELG